MTMIAQVREVRTNSLLVRDRENGQEVVVNTDRARCFSAGDILGIFFGGIMTKSLPPQITATRIWRIFPLRGCR